jgi:hypothetical protein
MCQKVWKEAYQVLTDLNVHATIIPTELEQSVRRSQMHLVASYSLDLFFGLGKALCRRNNGLPLC